VLASLQSGDIRIYVRYRKKVCLLLMRAITLWQGAGDCYEW